MSVRRLEIDVPDDGVSTFFSLVTGLDGTNYRLTFRWGARAGLWSLDVDREDGTSIVAGQIVNLGRDLLERALADAPRPPGFLIALGRTESVEPPVLGEIGLSARVGLFYFAVNG